MPSPPRASRRRSWRRRWESRRRQSATTSQVGATSRMIHSKKYSHTWGFEPRFFVSLRVVLRQAYIIVCSPSPRGAFFSYPVKPPHLLLFQLVHDGDIRTHRGPVGVARSPHHHLGGHAQREGGDDKCAAGGVGADKVAFFDHILHAPRAAEGHAPHRLRDAAGPRNPLEV